MFFHLYQRWAYLIDEVKCVTKTRMFQNKFLIFSVGGYLSLHIAGVAWGNEIFSKPKSLIKHYEQDAVVLMQWVFLMWSSLYSSIYLQVFLPPSRRLANWTYFNWMIAYNLTLLLLFLPTHCSIQHRRGVVGRFSAAACLGGNRTGYTASPCWSRLQ